MHFHLTEPQSKFFNLKCKFPLFIGGYGSGKSYMLVVRATQDLFSYAGVALGVYSPTYDLLKLNLIPRFREVLDELEIPHAWHKTDHIITVGDRKLIFRSMDHPERIIAYEVFRSYVDEADGMPKEKASDAWNRIIARNRQRRGGDNQISAYSTPEGYSFTYDRWSKSPAAGYQFVRASTHSNPHLDDDYVAGLKASYPDHLVRAYIGGYWVNLTTGSVYPQFDRKKNATTYLPKPRETLHVGMDFNVQRGCAIVHIIRDGLPYAVGEIIDSRDTVATVEALQELYPDHPIIVYPDASGKARTSQNSTDSDLERIREVGFRLNHPDANPTIKDRVAAMNAMFRNAKGQRRYKVNVDKCPNYCLALEQQIYDKNGQPDKSSNLDHPVDAAGYFIHRKYPIERRTAVVKKLGGF